MSSKNPFKLPGIPVHEPQPPRRKSRYSVTQQHRVAGDMFVGYVEAVDEKEAQQIASKKWPKDYIGLKGNVKVQRQASMDDPLEPSVQRVLDQAFAEEAAVLERVKAAAAIDLTIKGSGSDQQ